MEARSKRRKITLENVTEAEDVPFDFNNLPTDLLRIIFNYLSISERIKFGRVCLRWYQMSRYQDPVFWKKVVVLFLSYRTRRLTYSLLKMLPRHVTCLKLYYENGFDQRGVKFSKFSFGLLRHCPKLEELVILNALLDFENSRVIDISETFSEKLRILKLRGVRKAEEGEEVEDIQLIFKTSYESKIVDFDIGYSDLYIEPFFLSQMPCLRKLHLAEISLEKECFDSIPNLIRKLDVLDFQCLGVSHDILRHFLGIVREHCLNLTELYVCFNKLEDDDVVLLEGANVLPQLKVICLRGCPVSVMQINLLIDSSPSIDIVHVGSLKEEYRIQKYSYANCSSLTKIKIHSNDDVIAYCDHDEVCPPFRNEL